MRPLLRLKPHLVVVLCCSLAAGCGGSSTTPTPTPTTTLPAELPARPVAVTPAAGSQVSTDTATFTVQNARGFDQGQADYTFELSSASGRISISSVKVAAGSRTTSTTLSVPRGMGLSWSVTAASPSGASVSSDPVSITGAAVTCPAAASPYAKKVIDWFIPECSLQHNRYNDVQEVLGPPDSSGTIQSGLTGIVSLGEKGYVSVDMEACAVDANGPDVRVFQRASSEAVTLYAAGSPNGPWLLVGDRVPCGTPLEGFRSGYCEFDLGEAEISEARYFRIEDGEHYPCLRGDTDTEGADIDAIQILRLK